MGKVIFYYSSFPTCHDHVDRQFDDHAENVFVLDVVIYKEVIVH